VTWQERYKAHFYNRDRGWIDGTTEFHQLCAAHIPRGGRILEVGASKLETAAEAAPACCANTARWVQRRGKKGFSHAEEHPWRSGRARAFRNK
jgi:hypothetical protein